MLRMACITLHAQKAVRKTATFQVPIKFLAHVVRQESALGCPLRLKSRVVFFYRLVKKGALRALTLVSRRTLAADGFPASGRI
jgi:hypothetical protein